jgi:hypothetical protein
MTMQPHSDEHLVRYLVGDLPEAEAELLDEQSVTDEAFALRLRELENDLVDRHARGIALEPASQRLWQRLQQSPRLRDKVRFAVALQRLTGVPQPTTRRVPAKDALRSRWLQGLAAAAVLLLAVTGYLGLRMTQLRGELERVEKQRAAVDERNSQLREELERARPLPANPVAPAVFLLPAPRRGVDGPETTISIPRGSEHVILRLTVESEAYVAFWAAVRAPGVNRALWRSADVPAAAVGADRIVTLTIPATSLPSGRLLVELSGVMPDGSIELAANYPIRVVL